MFNAMKSVLTKYFTISIVFAVFFDPICTLECSKRSCGLPFPMIFVNCTEDARKACESAASAPPRRAAPGQISDRHQRASAGVEQVSLGGRVSPSSASGNQSMLASSVVEQPQQGVGGGTASMEQGLQKKFELASQV